MTHRINRRRLLSLAGTTLGAGLFLPNLWIRAEGPGPNGTGAVVGEPTAAKVGGEILASRGNAVDAAVAAALAVDDRLSRRRLTDAVDAVDDAPWTTLGGWRLT